MPPTVTNPGDQTSTPGESVSLQIEAFDPDGDLLTYAAFGLPTGLGVDTAAGRITGIVDMIAAGDYQVTVDVFDTSMASSSASFRWTVTLPNQPPMVTNPGNQTSAEGASVSLRIVASDPDGDVLTYSASGLPPGLTIDAGSGDIAGVIGFDAAGDYSVTVSASDGTSTGSVAFTWTVADTNRPPVVTSPGNQTTTEGATVSLQVVASDPDADTLAYSASGLPPGLGIDAGTGHITGTAPTNGASVHTVTVSASDGQASSSVTFTWIVTSPHSADVREFATRAGDFVLSVQDTSPSSPTYGSLFPGHPPLGQDDTTGIAAEGLLDAYRVTGEPRHLAGAILAGDFLAQRSGDFSPGDALFLVDLSELTGNGAYRDAVTSSYFDALVTGTFLRGGQTYTTAAYLAQLRAERTGIDANLLAWDLAKLVVAAYRVEHPIGIAFREALEDALDELYPGIERHLPDTTQPDPSLTRYHDTIALAAGIEALAAVGDPAGYVAQGLNGMLPATNLAGLADALEAVAIQDDPQRAGAFPYLTTGDYAIPGAPGIPGAIRIPTVTR